MNNEIIKIFLCLGNLIAAVSCDTCQIGKKTYSWSRWISSFDGLNFDCATSSNTLNCTNNFFTLICLFINHHTTFMALRFVLRPFTLRMHTARRSLVANFNLKILIVF